MIETGNMQGRLSPPEDGRVQFFPHHHWRAEFPLVAQAGLVFIEWLYDTWGEGYNPIETAAGLAEMAALSQTHGVAVRSLCAHYFVERPFVRATGRELDALVAKLEWLIGRCSLAGMRRVVVPFLDEGHIGTPAQEDLVLDVVRAALRTAVRHGVEIHLECGMAPAAYARFLERLASPAVKVLYDTGNSAAFGFGARDEMAAYGAHIASVHIKDRLRGGHSVPLGTGDANLPARIRALIEAGYGGDFVLEAARGDPGGELAWARRNLAIVARAFPGKTAAAFPPFRTHAPTRPAVDRAAAGRP